MKRVLLGMLVGFALAGTAAAQPATVEMAGAKVQAACASLVRQVLDEGGYVANADTVANNADSTITINGQDFNWYYTVLEKWDRRQKMTVILRRFPFQGAPAVSPESAEYRMIGLVQFGSECLDYTKNLTKADSYEAKAKLTGKFVNARGEIFGAAPIVVAQPEQPAAVPVVKTAPQSIPDLGSNFERAWKNAADRLLHPEVFLTVFAVFAILVVLLVRHLRRRRAAVPAAAKLANGLSFFNALALGVAAVATGYGIFLIFTDPREEMVFRLVIATGGGIISAVLPWVLWHFGLQRIAAAETFGERVKVLAIVSLFAVPFTGAMSTALGLAGIGGPNAQKLDMLAYLETLQGALTGDVLRAIEVEKSIVPTIEQVAATFKANADQEVSRGAVCGTGEGPLFKFYTARQSEADLLLRQVKDIGQRSVPPVGAIRELITVGSTTTFREGRIPLLKMVDEARRSIALAFDEPAYLAPLGALTNQLRAVTTDSFFAGWPQCQLVRKAFVQQQMLAIVRSLDGIAQAVRESKKPQGPTTSIPEFTLRNELVAVLDHWREVPYQLAFQIGLDAFPLVIAIFAVFIMPLPRRRDTALQLNGA